MKSRRKTLEGLDDVVVMLMGLLAELLSAFIGLTNRIDVFVHRKGVQERLFS